MATPFTSTITANLSFTNPILTGFPRRTEMPNEAPTFDPSFKSTDWRLWLKYLRIWLPQIIALSLAIVLIHMLTCNHYDTWHSWSWTNKFNFRVNALGK